MADGEIRMNPVHVLSSYVPYRTVYTWEYRVLYAAAVLALAVGVALFVWGRRRAARERAALPPAGVAPAERVRTLDRQDWRRLRRFERLRIAGAAVACLCLVFGFLGLHTRDQAHVNLRANIVGAYSPALLAVDEVTPTDGGYLVELHWLRPDGVYTGAPVVPDASGFDAVGGAPGAGEYDAIVVPDVLVTLEDRRRPTLSQIPAEVLEEWPSLGR